MLTLFSAPTALVGGLCICLVIALLRTEHLTQSCLMHNFQVTFFIFVQGFERLHVIAAYQLYSSSTSHARPPLVHLFRLTGPPAITTQI
jgi:hypothetical protein